MRTNNEKRQRPCRFPLIRAARAHIRLHPAFLAVGVWFCFTGELPSFLLSCIVAIQHECAHAFAAARLGYKLNKLVLMPYGAVIDGDLSGITLKDEITVAIWGPLCNLLTAAFFAALWWFFPTTYAFTDAACFSSLAIALVNLLPAYPLDGGRILRCVLARAFLKNSAEVEKAKRKAEKICRGLTFFFAAIFLFASACAWINGEFNLTLFAFSAFLCVGAFGNRDKTAVYNKLDYSCKNELKKGVELRRVAVLASCPIKDALRFVSRGTYLVLEVYDEKENHLFDLPQSELGEYFARAKTPYETLLSLKKSAKRADTVEKIA
ncbi:MAG: hypothetical protein IJX91_04395 [Clostridia bacterium]|nr:hypothetical protein [Clostridia bacterium]